MHQTGEKHFDTAKKAYESMSIQANIKPFIEDMAASLCLGRYGIMSCRCINRC